MSAAAGEKGPEWSTWKDFLVGREVIKQDDQGKQVTGVVYLRLTTDASVDEGKGTKLDKYATAWRINGKWNYDDCLDIQKAISYKQLKPMIQDRFIDHDKCGDRLKKLVLPLQQNNWHPLPEKDVEQAKQQIAEKDLLVKRRGRPPKAPPSKKPPKAPSAAQKRPAKQTVGAKRGRSAAPAASVDAQMKEAEAAASAPLQPHDNDGIDGDDFDDEVTTASKAKKHKATSKAEDAKAAPASAKVTPPTKGKKAPPADAPATGQRATQNAAAAGTSDTAGTSAPATKPSKAAGTTPRGTSSKNKYAGITGRVYPPESCCAPNDKPVGSPDDDDEEEFEVDALLDEAQIGGTKYYLVKWKGYELDVGSLTCKGHWEPRNNLNHLNAYDDWRSADRPDYYTAVADKVAKSKLRDVHWTS